MPVAEFLASEKSVHVVSCEVIRDIKPGDAPCSTIWPRILFAVSWDVPIMRSNCPLALPATTGIVSPP